MSRIKKIYINIMLRHESSYRRRIVRTHAGRTILKTGVLCERRLFCNQWMWTITTSLWHTPASIFSTFQCTPTRASCAKSFASLSKMRRDLASSKLTLLAIISFLNYLLLFDKNHKNRGIHAAAVVSNEQRFHEWRRWSRLCYNAPCAKVQ